MALPELAQLEFRTPEETATTGTAVLGKALQFDFESGDLVIQDGAPVLADGDAALRIWIEKVLRTERKKYDVYTPESEYGISLAGLIGSVLPRSFVQSELRREITESLVIHPNISGIANFDYVADGSWLKLSFQIVKADGTTTGMELII